MNIVKSKEMDWPTFNSLTYLTTVRGHPIVPKPICIDEFNRALIIELYSVDLVKTFEGTTRSYYTIEGHYQNLWLYDQKIVKRPYDPAIDEAIKLALRPYVYLD